MVALAEAHEDQHHHIRRDADMRVDPNSIITGTVISDVLPVTTLRRLVKKKIRTRLRNLRAGIKPSQRN
jgi:hypothetical protein